MKKFLGGWFPETAPNVDSKVSSLYYAADRKYNIGQILEIIDSGVNVILDRYFYSNMAHQGGKIENIKKRSEMYDWIEKLECELLELPIPDVKLFLHMPTDYSMFLRKNRKEKLDENEMNEQHLIAAERAYLEVASRYGFDIVECVKNISAGKSIADIKNPAEINEEVYRLVLKKFEK